MYTPPHWPDHIEAHLRICARIFGQVCALPNYANLRDSVITIALDHNCLLMILASSLMAIRSSRPASSFLHHDIIFIITLNPKWRAPLILIITLIITTTWG